MGKGNRNRIAKAQERAEKQKEQEKLRRRQKRIKIAAAILVPCFAVVLIGAIVLGSLSAAGKFLRSTISVTSDSYEIDNAMMSYFFNSQVQYYLSNTSSSSIDQTKSLKSQKYSDSQTWFDYFMASTKAQVQRLVVLAEAAKAEGMELTAEEKESIESQLNAIDQQAQAQGTTFNKYIADDYPLVAEMMREVGADAVCLNELDSCTTRTGGVFQLERIARAMGGWDYRFGRAMPYRGGSYGVGVMTRERILDHFTVALPRGEGAEPRVLTVVELARYVIATTHLDHTSAAAQRDQVAVINRVMRERYAEASKPVFLGGDLNALPDSGTLRALQEAWTVLTPTDGGTYPSHDPKKCIDYILQLDNGVTCETAGARVLHRFEAGDAARASDHLPVLLEIRLPAES